MASPFSDSLTAIWRQANHSRERLVLVVGPVGSGKTAWLRSVASEQHIEYVQVGEILTKALGELSPRQRPLTLSRTFETLLPPGDIGLCLDNTDILFLPELKCDPLRLVAQLSQHRLIVAALTGDFTNGRYTRAYPDHPEYVSRTLSGVTVASLSSGIPTFFQT